jgi:hypothetical protein
MIEDELSKLPEGALSDYRGDERLDRIWSRLEPEVAAPRPTRQRATWLYAPAFGAVFALGVFVGRTGLAPEPEPQVRAEPPAALEPGPRPLAPAGEARERAAAPRAPDRLRPSVPRPSTAPARPLTTETGAVALAAPPFPSAVPAGPPEWQSLAELGDLAGAYASLEQSGGFEAALTGASPEVLMTLVDMARATGSRDHAVAALRRLLNVHPDAPEAPLAAWTLGNLLEQSGDRAGSTEAFALYRRLSPTGDFAEDAAAREVESALSGGDLELARRLVDQYAKDFPQGRRAAELREELAKAEAEAAFGGAAATGVESEPVLPAAPTAPSEP